MTAILVRLENEHIGNTDQYRVTREVPLPYSFDEVVETSAVPTAASSHSKRPSRADEHISAMRAQVSKPPVVSQGKKRARPVDEDDEDGADYKADENQMEVDEDSPPEESDVVRSIPGVPDWLY